MKLLHFAVAVLLIGSATAAWYDQLINDIVENVLLILTGRGRLEILGHRCGLNWKPVFHRWKLHFDTKVYCNGWTNIVGKGFHQSPITSVRNAVRDFTQQAFAQAYQMICSATLCEELTMSNRFPFEERVWAKYKVMINERRWKFESNKGMNLNASYCEVERADLHSFLSPCSWLVFLFDFAARMKLSYFIFAFLVIGSATAGWEELIGPAVEKLMGLWKNEKMEFLGHQCNFSTSPSFYRWELYHNTKVICPGWTNIEGYAKTKSPTGSLKHATTDFVNKALQSGLVTEDQVKEFLQA
ncbi:unnamed protein product [Darwinula stevensoni]|uniref:Anti-lipopolysaccharide factor n=1 Tax=Darwinula stevensoni TaxID=69355 RepID=A0A7R8XDN0_9CRUS|nr:unnamed protein product [Darwinula stevensoni]CAG0893657.1 unnamed protein product [Darwinula stevensoni]